MATLLGQKINATYDSLLKTIDNDGITTSLKQMTDGVGQTTPLYLSTTEAKIGGNLEITGDLTVGGTTTYVNTDNVTVKDGLVLLANDNVADILDIGLYGKYNDGTVKYTGLYRDATDGVFKIFDGLATEPTTTVGGGDLADFAAAGGSFSGNLTLTTGKIFVNGAGNNGYINSKGAVAAQVLSVDDSRLFRGLDSSVQEVFYVQGTGDVFASGQLIIDSIVASGSVSAFNVTASNAITSGTLNVADAIIHTGDTDTMIEFLANQIKTTTGGVLNINTTPTKTTFYQDVGIGDTPDTLLHIKGSAPSFKIESSDTSGTLNIPAGSINFFGGYSNSIEIASIRSIDASSGGVAGQLAFYTSADPDTPTERMRIDSSGNVGIGTSSPTEKLEVVGDLKIQGADSGNAGVLHFGNDSDQVKISGFDSGGSSVQNALLFYTNTAERMRIDSSGNVGIGGSADSSYKLHLYGTNNSEMAFEATGAGGGFFRIGAGTTASGFAGALRIYDVNASAERMRIDSSGNVGIGENNPDREVDVKKATDNCIMSLVSGTTNISGLVLGDTADDDRGGILYNNTSDYLYFLSNATERMRITSGGYLKASNTGSYAGSSSPYHELYSSTDNSEIAYFRNSGATSPYGLSMNFSGASPNNTTNYFLYASDSTTARLIIYSNGNVVNTNNSYGALSDAKLKENIADASPKLDDLMQVQVRNFNYIGDDKKQIGVVAQELETIFPSMIDETPDFEEREVEQKDENGEIVYETEQVLVSEAVAEYTETIEHAEELDEDGNVITEAWTEEIVHPAKEAVYETVTTDRPVMTTERVDLGTTTKSVKYSVFVPILVKAMQEQQEIINKLEARIAALEAR